MNEIIFSWAENAKGEIVHVDSVPNGLNCGCTCPCCHEPLMAKHGKILAHGFAHHSMERQVNLKICYMVTMYKLAEQIIKQEKKIRVPSYYGIFKEGMLEFTEVTIDSRYDRIDKQPDVIAKTSDGIQYLIEFTFSNKVQHKEKIDYKSLNCLEIDLQNQTLETLYDFLLNYTEDKKWLNHQTYFDSIGYTYAQSGKSVSVVSEWHCMTCSIQDLCCCIKKKGSLNPIVIQNSGISYKICKTEEAFRIQRQKDEELIKKEIQERKQKEIRLWIEEERRIISGQREERLNRIKEQEELEIQKTKEIKSEDRNCFICKRNLDWIPSDGNFAHCGSYTTMQVPKNTPPESAKTCKGFRVKK